MYVSMSQADVFKVVAFKIHAVNIVASQTAKPVLKCACRCIYKMAFCKGAMCQPLCITLCVGTMHSSIGQITLNNG